MSERWCDRFTGQTPHFRDSPQPGTLECGWSVQMKIGPPVGREWKDRVTLLVCSSVCESPSSHPLLSIRVTVNGGVSGPSDRGGREIGADTI